MSQKIRTSVEIDGSLTASQIANATTDTDKFLVSDGGTVKYRTSAEILSDLGITLNTASKLQHQLKAGVAINKGQAVYVTSADGTNMIVGLASNASEATSSKTMGLLNATVVANGFADVVTEGLLDGLNTSTATVGDPVWLGTSGNLIYGLTNKPSAPNHLVFIGIVTRVNSNNGEIFVKVQNGFELNEIHDVDLKSTTPSGNDILAYEGAPVNLWKNKTIPAVLGYTPYNASNPAGYISSYTETDPTVPSYVKSITSTEKSNWNTAFGWGNHASAGYALSGHTHIISPVAESSVSPNGISIQAGPGSSNPQGWSYPYGTKLSAITGAGRSFEIMSTTYPDGQLALRTLGSGGIWDSWKTILDTSNYSTYAVPLSRTITINGTSYDLSANRSWTVSAAETDTLATVTARGASTSALSTFDGGLNIGNAKLRWGGTTSPTLGFPFTGGPNGFWIDVNDGDTGGIVIDNDGTTIYGAGDSGHVFRVIDEDVYQSTSNVDSSTTFRIQQGQNGGGYIRGNFNITGYSISDESSRAPIFYDSNDTGYYTNPAGTSNLAATYIAGHYYGSYNTGNILIRSAADTSDVGIVGQNSSGGFKFQLYGNGTDYGFLNGTWASWDLRKNINGNIYLNNQSTYYYGGDVTYMYRVYGTADMRSPIYYDNNDTGYYVDPNGDSRLYRTYIGNYTNYMTLGIWDGVNNRIEAIGQPLFLTSYGGSIKFGYQSSTQMELATSGVLNVQQGYISTGNPWGTSNSAFFPNGITTAGSDNWIYGHTYIGNSPGNGNGHEFWASGREYHLSSESTTGHGASGKWVSKQNASGNFIPYSFESEYGNHSWGTVARFRINQSGADRPSIQFSNATNDTRWNIGYCYADDNFRIVQNMGYRNDNSTSDSWGTERLILDTAGNFYSNGLFQSNASLRAPIFYDSNNTGYYLDPNGGSNISTITAQDYYNNGWFRNNNSNTGLYNQVTYQHWSSNTNGYWDVSSTTNATSGVVGIRLYAGGHVNTLRGYLYSDGSGMGLLNNQGGWSVIGYQGAGYGGELRGSWTGTGDLRAPIFYDSNNTAYYVNPASATRLNGYLSFGIPGNGANANGRWLSIEGNADVDGEGSGRLFFTEHNSTTGSMDSYGLSIGYRGGATSVTTAGGNTWTGLSAIDNGAWGFWGHDGSTTGALAMYGPRTGAYIAATGDFRAPIFYDSNNTGYYVDPASTSNMNSISAGGYIYANNYIESGGAIYGTIFYDNNNRSYYCDPHSTSFFAGLQANSNIQSPIYYDYNNTGYYVDPASTSNLNVVDCANRLQAPWIGINNSSSSSGNGLSLYGANYGGGQPTYGIMFAGTSTFGTFGSVTADWATYFTMDSTANRGWIFRNMNGAGNIASISNAGVATFAGDVVAYGSSDRQLKDNISPIENALEKVKQIGGYTFDWNDKQDVYTGNDIGVIAQEIEEVLPQIVTTRDNGYKAVKYEKIVPLLIEAIKEQQTQIEELKQLVQQLTQK